MWYFVDLCIMSSKNIRFIYSRVHNATVGNCSKVVGPHRMLVQILKFISDIRIFRHSFCLVAYDTLDLFFVTLRRVYVSETVTDIVWSRSFGVCNYFLDIWLALSPQWFETLPLTSIRVKNFCILIGDGYIACHYFKFKNWFAIFVFSGIFSV
jgi:hypothetical protein